MYERTKAIFIHIKQDLSQWLKILYVSKKVSNTARWYKAYFHIGKAHVFVCIANATNLELVWKCIISGLILSADIHSLTYIIQQSMKCPMEVF